MTARSGTDLTAFPTVASPWQFQTQFLFCFMVAGLVGCAEASPAEGRFDPLRSGGCVPLDLYGRSSRGGLHQRETSSSPSVTERTEECRTGTGSRTRHSPPTAARRSRALHAARPR